MSELDTVTLLREMKDRQRERARFNYQRVTVDSVMMIGLTAVLWLSVKVGLGLHAFTRVVQDPVGAADNAARGLEIKALRRQIRVMEGPVRPGDRVQSKLGRLAAVKAVKERLGRLEAEQRDADEDEVTPGIPVLRDLDGFLEKYGPVAPVGIMGGNILMELLRVRRMREL